MEARNHLSVIILTTEMFPAAGALKHSLPSLVGFADPCPGKTFRNEGADRPEELLEWWIGQKACRIADGSAAREDIQPAPAPGRRLDVLRHESMRVDAPLLD